jgi:hypothetical protein
MLRRRDRDGHAELAQCGIRLGPAARDLFLSQGFDEARAIVLRPDYLREAANAGAGEKDDKIEFAFEENCRRWSIAASISGSS